MFVCERCTREVKNEEAYLLYRRKYCRSCMVWIENDPETEILLGRFEQIEN